MIWLIALFCACIVGPAVMRWRRQDLTAVWVGAKALDRTVESDYRRPGIATGFRKQRAKRQPRRMSQSVRPGNKEVFP